MIDHQESALHEHLRVSPEQWERLEQTAQGNPLFPGPSPGSTRDGGPRPPRMATHDTEMRAARASLFAAQAIARKLIADGREPDK